MFATVAEPRATRFELRWPEAAAVDAVTGWQRWASAAPDDVIANLSLVAEPGHPLRVTVFGVALRDAEPATVLLESLAVRVGVRPEIRHQVLTWRDLKRSFAGRNRTARLRRSAVRSSSPARCRHRRSSR